MPLSCFRERSTALKLKNSSNTRLILIRKFPKWCDRFNGFINFSNENNYPSKQICLSRYLFIKQTRGHVRGLVSDLRTLLANAVRHRRGKRNTRTNTTRKQVSPNDFSGITGDIQNLLSEIFWPDWWKKNRKYLQCFVVHCLANNVSFFVEISRRKHR